MYLQVADLAPKGSTVRHGFFSRKGGVSAGLYEGLNCGPGSSDNPASVAENRRKVAEALKIPPDRLISVRQIHSNICLYADAPFSAKPEADSMVTDKPDLALGILTADCAPVLFYGENAEGGPVIGAAHAGWGGALKGVLESTVKVMKEHGTVPESIRAAVGPCICQSSYEVSASFAEPFLQQDPENDHFFQAGHKEGRPLFDLPGYCARRLSLTGVKTITLTNLDTYKNEADYYSFRRATHRKEPDYGRQISAIVIKS